MATDWKAYFENLATSEGYEKPKFRLLATSGPLGVKYPFRMGQYSELESAKKDRWHFERKGFQIKVQNKTHGIWEDLDADQTKFSL